MQNIHENKQIISEIEKHAKAIDSIINNNKNIIITKFSEDFYNFHIHEVETENLLMNGIYTYEQLKELISNKKNFIDEIMLSKIEIILNNRYENDKILFWNM